MDGRERLKSEIEGRLEALVAMTTLLTWIAGLSSLLQSSIISTTIHTAVEQLDYTGTATVNTVASTIHTMNCTP